MSARSSARADFVLVGWVLEKRYGPVSAWTIVFCAFGLLMITIGLWHLLFLPSGGRAKPVSTAQAARTFLDVLVTFFRKKYILWGIVFLVLYRFAEGLAIKIAPLFLRAARDHGGLGLSTADAGWLYGVFPPIAFVLGSIAAGYFTAGRGLRKSLLVLCAAFNIPFAVYLFLALVQPADRSLITVLVSLEWLGYGFRICRSDAFHDAADRARPLPHGPLRLRDLPDGVRVPDPLVDERLFK